MRDEAEKRIGHLYPKARVTKEMARERPDLKPYVRPRVDRHRLALGTHSQEPQSRPSPTSTCRLASTFMLSTKKGKEAYTSSL